jgi:CHAD domain-containing protein
MNVRALEHPTRPATASSVRSRSQSSRTARGAAKPDLHPLGPLVQKHSERLASLISSVLAADDVESVHDLRVVTRRLEQALIALYPEGLLKPAKRLRRTLRRIRRSLGAWRNCDVTLGMAAQRRRRTRSPRRRAAWDLVRQYLEQRRLEECVRARRKLLGKNLWGFARRLQGAFRELLPVMPAERVQPAVRAGAEGAWARWLETYTRAEAERDVESVHALRIATKRLRYQVELARELGEGAAEPLLEWCRALQERLGDWHDHQILQQSMAEALARPELVLSDLEAVQVGLEELTRERRAFPPDDPAILAAVQLEAGHEAVAKWLGDSPAPAVSTGSFTRP